MVWEGAFGFIDTTGKLVIPYRFYYADHFSEGLAVVKTANKGKYGYVDQFGAPVISERFAHASSFCHGLASVITKDSQGRRYGYIDRRGEYVWEPSR